MFSKVSKLAFVFAAAALVSCTQDDMEGAGGKGGSTPASGNLTTVHLAGFAADDSRVTYEAPTRTDEELAVVPASLELVATIANPSKTDGFNYEGRYLSATCVYYDEVDDKFYVTYHMQGNNYNTSLETETAGAIQSFSVNDEGVVTLDKGFRAAAPEVEDFDFNHLYFDKTSRRVLAGGHRVKNGNMKNTDAVIGVFDPVQGTYKYATVKTGEKAYDEKGKSLGYKDAGDVNCMLRVNDVPLMFDNKSYGWNLYFVATRKGMAVLSAHESTLFQPALKADGTSYFIDTPGSAKYVSPTGTSSYYGLLYLTSDYKAENGTDITADTSSPAKIAHLSLCTSRGLDNGDMKDWGRLQNRNGDVILDPQDLENYEDQEELPAVITPVDGKNTLAIHGYSETYVALGKSGMYYNSLDAKSGVKTFGGRPVNCVAMDLSPFQNATKGFLYVANGSKLTVLDNYTLAEVATYSDYELDEDKNVVPSSANYVTVRRTNSDNSSVRYVAVAFGQNGVKVFKFTPEHKE